MIFTFRVLIALERRFNHPYGRKYPGHLGSHWVPRSKLVCRFADWYTRGRCHD